MKWIATCNKERAALCHEAACSSVMTWVRQDESIYAEEFFFLMMECYLERSALESHLWLFDFVVSVYRDKVCDVQFWTWLYIFVKRCVWCMLMPWSRWGLHSLLDEDSSFTPMVACEAAKTQIWFCLCTVPVFKPFNSTVFKLYWNLFVSKEQREIDYIIKVFIFL